MRPCQSEGARLPEGPQTQARRRLAQAHELWHRALDAYPRVDDFCLAVNGLLQTLRTVTWILQKSFRHIEGFNSWYAECQASLANDPVMRWAVEARNHIEKEGDLDLQSTARVSIVASWLAAPYDDFLVPPLIPPDEIAKALLPRDIPDRIRRDGVLAVERRWVTASLPDQELLSVCAHVYHVLDSLVAEAERKFAMAGEDHSRADPPRRLDCMVAGHDSRTARLHIQTGKLLAYERAPVAPSSSDESSDVAARYGPYLAGLLEPGGTLESHVRLLHDMGSTILSSSGHYSMDMYLFREGRLVATLVLQPRDQQDKFMLVAHAAEDVKRVDADEVVSSAEVWMAPWPGDETNEWVWPAERPDRAEGFITTGVSRTGRAYGLTSPVQRGSGNITLGEAEASDLFPNYLLPVRRAWET
jgi:hypothetical protein